MTDPEQKLDFAERWLRDGLLESAQAGALESVEVDVSEAAKILATLKSAGRSVTWTHVFVRAAAVTLARNADLHQMVAGRKKVHPACVDICLSVADESSVNPTIIIEDAAGKDLFGIAAEVVRRTPEAIKEGQRFTAALRRWGWMLPLSFLRRWLIRFLLRRMWYRRKVSGTFQVSCVSHVDLFAPLLFNTAAALGVGRVRDRVIVVNGAPAVRPVVTLTCCLDHTVWNGMSAARFLISLRDILTSCEFMPASTQTCGERH